MNFHSHRLATLSLVLVCVALSPLLPLRADPSPSPAPLWLGTPGVDPAAARERYQRRLAAVAKWQTDQVLTAYDRVGSKNPRWDEDVRESLRLGYASPGAGPGEKARLRLVQNAAITRALKAGCDDPLLRYYSVRASLFPDADRIAPDDLARLYVRTEADLAASDYPPLFKFSAAVRAAEKIMACRRNRNGRTFSNLPSGYREPAASWPRNTDIATVFRHACTQLIALLHDPSAPAAAYNDLVTDCLVNADADPVGQKELIAPLAELFQGDTLKDLPPYTVNLVSGWFWMKYAWDARGGGFPHEISDEGWKLFRERMDKAGDVLTAAWKLEPEGVEAPTAMIDVSGIDRERLGGDAGEFPTEENVDPWFRRAMDAHPNDYRAGFKKLFYLAPNWSGSEDMMIAFGRQCLATQDWDSRLPLVLLDAHITLARDFHSDDRAGYWRRPGVWSDLREMYSTELAAGPDFTFDRTIYALYAFRAGDWKTAHEQFELVGDEPDLHSLQDEKTTLRQFQDMRHEAADRAGR